MAARMVFHTPARVAAPLDGGFALCTGTGSPGARRQSWWYSRPQRVCDYRLFLEYRFTFTLRVIYLRQGSCVEKVHRTGGARERH